MISPSPWARTAFTILAVAFATLLRYSLNPVFGGGVPFITYYPIVVLCAWYGGWWQGLLSTVLSGIGALYFFLAPQQAFALLTTPEWVQLSLFLVASTLISLLAETLHRARTKAEANEAKAREQSEQFRVTLNSIGDAVIATDVKGRVTFMNPVAETLTGWKHRDALGKPLEEVFKIVNEQDRNSVVNPALRAIQEGVIVGLANHTVLISRDQTEIPIDDSGAPIKNAAGRIIGSVLIFRDITDRRLADDRFRLVVEAAPNAMVMVDDGGRIILVNSQTERLFGYTREELIGRPIELLVPERFRNQHPEYRAGFARVPQARPMGAGRDLFGLHRDGSEVPIEIGLNPLEVKGKTFVLSSIVDISARKRAEEERSRLLASEHDAREAAEAASRAKDEFVAMISHEIRSPLNAVLGWAQMLRTGKLDKAGRERAIETIERNAKLQVQIIEDLMDISRVITGKLNLSIRPVEPVQIVEAAIDSIRPAAEAKAIHIDVHIDSKNTLFLGDPNRLQQIVWNLLSNAVKFTPRLGRIEIKVERIESYLEICVSDTGAGIEPEFLPYVFDRFSQASTGSERKHGGLGLGLAIVRHLVELHGGSVKADSPGVGHGATFTVSLPVGPERALASQFEGRAVSLEKAHSLSSVKILDGLTVMIVDDEVETRELLTAILTGRGAEVISCGSAAEALTKLERLRPNLLVSDVGMPEEDGYSLIRKVRELGPEQGGNIPAVALTAYARSEDRLRALAAGFQMHVPKPVEAFELIMVLAGLIGRISKV